MIYKGDCRDVLQTLPENSVQCVVTSPPYWGLRDYGVSGQLGLEPSPEAYCMAMVEVFAEVWRVLRDDGVCWLNLGDTYSAQGGGGESRMLELHGEGAGIHSAAGNGQRSGTKGMTYSGIKSKNLVGIPWRVAFALQADGWYLRSDIIWSKPNPMPESVQDRPTKAHEYIFLLTKSARYYYNAAAIREPYVRLWDETNGGSLAKAGGDKALALTVGQAEGHRGPYPLPKYTGQATKDYDAAGAQNPSDTKRRVLDSMERLGGANKRSVWTVATQPFPGAHFATFPEALVEPCILAGSKEGDTVLDPFAGSGTVGVVCVKAQRQFIGIELNPAYVELAEKRIASVAPLFSETA